MVDEVYPVQWTGLQAIVVLPKHIDLSNSARVLGELMAVINRGATALIADMTATVACDHSGTEAIARARQRALTSGTDLRLVVPSAAVRRTLAISGADRRVPVHPSRNAALAARAATAARALLTVSGGPAGASAHYSPPGGTAAPAAAGTEIALLDRAGVIVSVNNAWLAFAAANGGNPERTGRGMSYLDVCAEAADDPGALKVAMAIRRALAGDLPGPLTVEVSCHSPDTDRWFEMLISARRDGGGRPLGATVTLSPSRSEHLIPAADDPASAGVDDSGDLVTSGLFGAGLALEAALGLLGDHPAASSVRDAVSDLELAISDIRDRAFDDCRPRADRQ